MDIIVTAGDGEIVLQDAANMSTVNIIGEEVFNYAWTLNGTTATYGTPKQTLITVSGVKSVSGISLSGKVVNVPAAALNATNVTVSDGYTLTTDGTKPSTTEDWSLNGTNANYVQTTTAGYNLSSDAKSISYTPNSSKTLVTVKGVKSTKGLAIDTTKKIVTVAKSHLNATKVTVGNGYTLALASDASKSTTKKVAWNLSGTTATYKSSYKTAGYTLSSNKKSIAYFKATTAKNLVTIKGAKSKSILVSGKKITLKNSLLNKKVTVNGGKGNDTIKILGTGTVAGGAGADVFYYKSSGKNVISDYAAEDKISIASGAVATSTSGDDLVLTVSKGKITVVGGKSKTVTYIDTGGTLTADYSEDVFDLSNYPDYKNKVVTINAAKVTNQLQIIANKKANKITGGNGNDTIDGGKNNDKIYGGVDKSIQLYSANGEALAQKFTAVFFYPCRRSGAACF